LEALDSHWRQVPFFKTVILKVVPEEAARIAMLRTGETDLAEMSLASKRRLKGGTEGVYLSEWHLLSDMVVRTGAAHPKVL